MSNSVKARSWSAVAYPENMVPSWREDIGDILQLPCCYCLHDQDVDAVSNTRKPHLHIIIVFPNTTTHKNALSVINRLSFAGLRCCPVIEPVVSLRHCYDYLIHDTEESREKGKYQYDPINRICKNGFDIGSLEQISTAERAEIRRNLADLLVSNCFINFTDFYSFVASSFDDFNYIDVLFAYSGLYERLCKGNYLKLRGEDHA